MASFKLAAVLMCLISTASAYDFYVGGQAGWVENPKESYNNWAGRMRFQVNDKLVFKYKKTGDSVLVVKKEDYDSCNVNNPIQKLEGGGGSASFQFNRSGPFSFISGAQDGCSKGQKMIVVVMAVRGNNPLPPPPPATAPTPSLQPPTSSPSPSPSPSASPIAAPTPSPSSGEPSPSPSTVVSPPVPPPSSVIGGGGGPTGNEPAASPTSAPPAKSSSSALTASRVTIGTVVLVLAHAFLG